MADKQQKTVQLPHSVDAEMYVLGACLMGNEYETDIVLNALTPGDFYAPKHQVIYQAIVSLRADDKIPEMTAVADQLGNRLEAVGGAVYLAELVNHYLGPSLLDQNIETVRTKAQLRAIAKRCRRLIDLALAGDETAIEQAQALGYDLAAQTAVGQPTDYATVMTEVWDLVEERYKAKTVITGVPTGFTQLDLMTSGMQPGDYIILAARPSMGKTALMLNIAENAARMGFSGFIASLEMGRVALGQRSLSGASRVNMQRIRTGRCDESDFSKLSRALGRLSGLPLWVDDTSRSIAEIRATVRRLVAQHGVKFVCIDYLQLIADSLPNRNREQEVSMISRQIKGMAREFNVPFLVLSQLSRETTRRTGCRPVLADLRDSGSLEQDADLVMFVHRDDYYDPDTDRKGIANIIIAKQRNGPTGEIELYWDAETTMFRQLEKEAS